MSSRFSRASSALKSTLDSGRSAAACIAAATAASSVSSLAVKCVIVATSCSSSKAAVTRSVRKPHRFGRVSPSVTMGGATPCPGHKQSVGACHPQRSRRPFWLCPQSRPSSLSFPHPIPGAVYALATSSGV